MPYRKYSAEGTLKTALANSSIEGTSTLLTLLLKTRKILPDPQLLLQKRMENVKFARNLFPVSFSYSSLMYAAFC